MAEKKRLTISLDLIDYTALEELAARGDRSLSWLIGQAVKSYVRAEKSDADASVRRESQTPLTLSGRRTRD